MSKKFFPKFWWSIKWHDYEFDSLILLKKEGIDIEFTEKLFGGKFGFYHEIGYRNPIARFLRFNKGNVKVMLRKGGWIGNCFIKKARYLRRYKYMSLNQRNLKYIVVDLDDNFFNIYLENMSFLPEPTFVLINLDNFHAHIFYEIEEVINLFNNKSSDMVEKRRMYLNIYKRLVHRWDGDRLFGHNALVKNPVYNPNFCYNAEDDDKPWLLFIPSKHNVYSLKELDEILPNLSSKEIKKFKSSNKRSCIKSFRSIKTMEQLLYFIGLFYKVILEGKRNVTLFNILREYAYGIAFDFNNYEIFFNHLLRVALTINSRYCFPLLKYNEVKWICKSISKFIFNVYRQSVGRKKKSLYIDKICDLNVVAKNVKLEEDGDIMTITYSKVLKREKDAKFVESIKSAIDIFFERDFNSCDGISICKVLISGGVVDAMDKKKQKSILTIMKKRFEHKFFEYFIKKIFELNISFDELLSKCHPYFKKNLLKEMELWREESRMVI